MRYMINTYGNVDLGTLDWNISGSNFYAYYISNNIKKPEDDNTTANIYCNLYRAVPLNASFVEGDMALSTNGYLYIRDTRYATTAEFKEAMRGQILRYELETPANGGYLPMYKGRYKVSDVCQLFIPDDTHTVAGVTITNNGDGSLTIDGTGTGSGPYTNFTTLGKDNMPYKIGDKLFISAYVISGTCSYLFVGFSQSGNPYIVLENPTEGTYYSGDISTQNKCEIRDCLGFYVGNNTFNNFRVKFNIIDLTEMYGAGNELTTVEQFRQDFPNDLYPYSPYCWAKMKQMRYITTTKNLFDIPLTRGYPSNTEPYDNTTLRTFTFGTYIIGMTRNNYCIPSHIANVNISKNSISFKTADSGFGISVPFLLTVGNTYTVSCKADNNFYPGIGITYYKEDGTLISFTDSEIITNNPVKSFTVPENTYYTLILFYGRTGNEYTFSNIQLELGDTATPYVPYSYLPLK